MDDADQLTLDDYTAAFRLVRRRRRWITMALTTFLALAGALSVEALVREQFTLPRVLSSVAIGVSVGFAALFFGLPWADRRTLRRQLDQLGEEALRVRFTLDDGRLTMTTPQSTTTLAAADFLEVRRDDRVVLLYRTEKLFQIVPVRMLTDELESFIARIPD